MELVSLKTSLIKPQDDLLSLLNGSLKRADFSLGNGDILVITSKVISVSENRIATCKSDSAANKIAKAEADHWLGGRPYPFAIKQGILIPRSGVDASNIEAGKLVLWPNDPWKSANDLRSAIRKKFKLKHFGLIITDSTCRPLRHGVSNIAIAWTGFEGVSDERGKADLFGKKLKVTKRALADSLAAAAGVLTGEAAESIPFVLIRKAPVKFTSKTVRPKKFQPKDCLYAPIYSEKFRRLKI